MFDKAMPHIERAIEQCHFYAFDLEMTGLHVADQRESWIDDMEDRYSVVRFCAVPHQLLSERFPPMRATAAPKAHTAYISKMTGATPLVVGSQSSTDCCTSNRHVQPGFIHLS